MLKYFHHKSFITWGTSSVYGNLVCGHFTIKPCNNQYNCEFYYCYSIYNNNKYKTYATKNSDYSDYNSRIFDSPWFDSEEAAIEWLEKKFILLVRKKVKKLNQQLRSEISKNNLFVKNILNKEKEH